VSVLRLHNIQKSYQQGATFFEIIKSANLSIKSGEVFSLIGPSGCGKSTVLQIAGLLDAPSSGSVFIEDLECNLQSDIVTTDIRRDKIGFIYQSHHLLVDFTALENVMLPLLISGMNRFDSHDKAEAVLKDLNLGHRLKNLPTELSGGEQQRVAIARALVHNPKLILADEPTGNLDPTNSNVVFDELLSIAKKRGVAVLIVTHNIELAQKTDKIYTINKGLLELYKDEASTNIDEPKPQRRRSNRPNNKA
jgi:lipoprotein-releasing system ATP-binding protein